MTARHRRWARPRRRRRHGATSIDQPAAPQVRLGRRAPGSVVPAVFALVELGCIKRPGLARRLRCQAEVRMDGYPTVRMTFTGHTIFVEDAPGDEEAVEPPGDPLTGEQLAALEEIAGEIAPHSDPMLDTYERTARFAPDVVAEGALEDLVALFTTPMVRGIPNPARPGSWAAISWLAAGRVRIRGNVLRARQLIQLLQL